MRNLNDMMAFALVVDKGSFTAAADSIGLPKSNISRKISRLENELGVKLLQRTTRALSLTEIGRVYYEHCTRIQDEINHAESCVETLSAAPRGRLKISASTSVGQHLLAPNLAAFQTLYPDINIDLQLSNRRVDAIDEAFDLLIRVGPLQDSQLISRQICTASLQLFASPNYLQQNPKPNNIEDLKKHRCLYMTEFHHQTSWPNLKKKNYFEIRPSLCCDDFSVLHQLLLDNLGIALLPSYIAKTSVEQGRLVVVLEEMVGLDADIFIVFPSRKNITPKVRVFIDYLSEVLG